MSRRFREIASPFVVAPSTGARVRTRLHVSNEDATVLTALAAYLGSLASKDLATRCSQGRLGPHEASASRTIRKRALTSRCSSRWAGALTRTSEDSFNLAWRNLTAERRTLALELPRSNAVSRCRSVGVWDVRVGMRLRTSDFRSSAGCKRSSTDLPQWVAVLQKAECPSAVAVSSLPRCATT